MNKLRNILFTIILAGLLYPCIDNCSPPVASAGDDYTVINGGSGLLDGSSSYDPDDFDKPLNYYWSTDSDEYYFSYCKEDGAVEECSISQYLDPVSCWMGKGIWGKRSYSEDECIAEGYSWDSGGGITVVDREESILDIANIYVGELIESKSVSIYLVVNDGEYISTPDRVDVILMPSSTNSPPIGNAGYWQSAYKGDVVSLDGSASYDLTNTGQLNYTWTQFEGTTVTFENSSVESPIWTFIVPDVSENNLASETLKFSLTVNDLISDSNSFPDTAIVEVTYNFIPVSDAGVDTSYPVNAFIVLDGSQSYDLEGEDLIYSWSQTSGNVMVDLSATDTSVVSFTAPSSEDELVFKLDVYDGENYSINGSAHDLFISEYADGAHDVYLEIYNGTGGDIDLSNYELWAMRLNQGDYEIDGSWADRKLIFDPKYNKEDNSKILYELEGFEDCIYINSEDSTLVLPNNSVLTIFQAWTDYSEYVTNETYNSSGNTFEGRYLEWNSGGLANLGSDDAFGLAKDGVLIDIIGNNGGYSGAWPVAGEYNMKAVTLVRKPNIIRGNPVWWMDSNGKACELPDYNICDPGSAGSNKENTEWNIYSGNTYSFAGSHICTSCDSEVKITIEDNDAPTSSISMVDTDTLIVTGLEIVKGFKCFLKGTGLDATPTGIMNYYWTYPSSVSLSGGGEYFEDGNGDGVWNEGESFIDSNNNLSYDSGGPLVYFDTSELEEGVYSFSLAVNDGSFTSNISSLSVSVLGLNTAPIVDGGTYLGVNENEDVVLFASEGTATFDDTFTGEPLSYFWNPLAVIEDAPGERISWSEFGTSNANIQEYADTLKFLMPYGFGSDTTLFIELTVCDSKDCSFSGGEFSCSSGYGLCAHDTISVNMNNAQYPVAHIDQSDGYICNQGTNEEARCDLTATQSYDPGGAIVSYSWSTSSDLKIEDPNSPTLTFFPNLLVDDLGTTTSPNIIKEDTEYQFYLTVGDNDLDSKQSRADTVSVVIKATRPYAIATLNGYYSSINDNSETIHLVAGVEYELNGYRINTDGEISGDPNADKTTLGYHTSAGTWSSQLATKTIIAQYQNKELLPLPGYSSKWDFSGQNVSSTFVLGNSNSLVSSILPGSNAVGDHKILLTVIDSLDSQIENYDGSISDGCSLSDEMVFLTEDGKFIYNTLESSGFDFLTFNMDDVFLSDGDAVGVDVDGSKIALPGAGYVVVELGDEPLIGCGTLLSLNKGVSFTGLQVKLGDDFLSYKEYAIDDYLNISEPDTLLISVHSNEKPVAIVNHKYNYEACTDNFDTFSVSEPEALPDCWDVRVGVNSDTIQVLSGSSYFLDGSHSYDNTPRGVMTYEWSYVEGGVYECDLGNGCQEEDCSTLNKSDCENYQVIYDAIDEDGSVYIDTVFPYIGWELKPLDLNEGQSLLSTDGDETYFTVPNVPNGFYTFSLIVSDGILDSDPKKVVLKTAQPSTLSPPLSFYAKVIPEENNIQLVWSSEPERELDSLTGYRDFEGYNIYRSVDGGITWGGSNDKIYDFESNHVGWKPYVQFDMSEEQDTLACLYEIDLLGNCPSGVRRKKNIEGADPVRPWVDLGENVGLQTTFIDTNVLDGVEYTYAITSYDMGLQTFEENYIFQYTYSDTMEADSFYYHDLDYEIVSSFQKFNKNYYVLDPLSKPGGENLAGNTVEIYEMEQVWDVANPGQFSYTGGVCSGEDTCSELLVYSDCVASGLCLWTPNDENALHSRESLRGEKKVTIRNGYHATNKTYPDLDEFISIDCQTIGNGNQFINIVDDYELAEYQSEENFEPLIKLEIQADQLDISNPSAIEQKNIFQNYSTENPFLYIFSVEYKESDSGPHYYEPLDMLRYDDEGNSFYFDIIDAEDIEGDTFSNPVLNTIGIGNIDYMGQGSYTDSELLILMDEILNLPGADTTQCLQAGDIQSICLEYPNYLIDPSPVLYKDSQNLNDNWTEAFGGVRFRFDNARNIYDTSFGYEIDLKEKNFSDSTLSYLIDVDFEWKNTEVMKRRPPYAYKVIFSNGILDTAIQSGSGCDLYPTFLPFRVYNLVTGKKVNLTHGDKGIYNGCDSATDDLFPSNQYYCQEPQDYLKHPGSNDCVWTRNEYVELQDRVMSSLGAQGSNSTGEEYETIIYKMKLDYSFNSLNTGYLADWSKGSAYSLDDKIKHAGMAWVTTSEIVSGSALSKSEPNSKFLDENLIDTNPWRPIYPWSDGDSLIITPERWYVDGDFWIADLAELGKDDPIEAEDVNNVKVVPNPFIIQSGFMGSADYSISFTHLPTSCTIKIFTVTGELVRTLNHNDLVNGYKMWDLRNRKGSPVAPGLYIYAVEAGEHKKIGKFAIVR